MNFKKPKFWDYKYPNILSYFLLPLTVFFEISNFILNLKKKNKHGIKTICVGNIYVGGTGKTPTTIRIYKILKTLGFSACVGKKIYKNQIDEITILKNQTDLFTGSLRNEIVDKAIKNQKKIIIFDDGLQDKQMYYDLKIVCFDSANLVGNNFLIPAGPLRQRINSLSNYDCVILKGKNKYTKTFIKKIKNINKKITVFNTYFKVENLKNYERSKKYIIFSGIGNPESFKQTLLNNKFKIIKEIIFPDHYNYKIKDINKIKKIAIEKKAQIITTEKDFVKLSKNDRKNINYLKVSTKFKNEKRFLNYLKIKMYEKH